MKIAPNTHYRCAMDFKLSRNYQFIGGSVGFGRDALPNESREDLIKDVQQEVGARFMEQMAQANEMLGTLKKG